MANATTPSKSRSRLLIEQAEGYLDLATALDGPFSLDEKHRDALINAGVDCLNQIQNPLGHKPYVLYLKGQACRIVEDHKGAIHYLEQSRRIDPDNLHLYLALAWSYKRCDRVADAIAAMKCAVQLDAESAIAHYNLACYFALEEQVESALMHLSFAFELDSRYRELALYEKDFDLIRGDSRFSSLTNIADCI